MRGIKTGLIIAGCLILIGGIIFCIAMVASKWDFSKLSSAKMQTNDYIIEEDFNNISINEDTAKIDFLPAEDGKCKVVCYEDAEKTHDVKVEKDVLVIAYKSENEWYDNIKINFSTPKITVYLPKSAYDTLKIDSDTSDVKIAKEFTFNTIDINLSTGDVNCYASATEDIRIKASTGDINVEGITAATLYLTVSTGKITANAVDCSGDVNIKVTTGDTHLSDFRCSTLTTDGDTGDITLEHFIASDKLNVVRSTGDVRLVGADAGEIYIETDTGKVSGSLLSEKIFIPRTDTGKIDVPKTTSGGICEITTDTGDIKITIN